LQRALLTRLAFLSLALFGGRAAAEASLFIYPTLVMFEGNSTSAEVTITNRGDENGTFEIGWVNMSMTPEGGLMRHDDDVSWSIQPFVRYSPRRATLAPSESQVVKIALRRSDTIAEGEYYSHMRIVTINSAPVEALDENAPQAEPGVSVTARPALAIPVIWRNSRAESQAAIESIALDAETNAVNVEVERMGLLSARGFLHLVAREGSGDMTSLADPMPLIVYPTVDRRTVSLPLPDGLSTAGLPPDAEVVFSDDESLTATAIVYSTRRIFPEP